MMVHNRVASIIAEDNSFGDHQGAFVERMPVSEQITVWLRHWRQGDEEARDNLFAVVHPQLRQIATRLLQGERPDHTLEPNALVNELCLRLFGNQPINYQDRAHFYAIAAQTMRRILIDHARAVVAGKRGGLQQRVTLSGIDGWTPVSRNEDLLALDLMLSKLAVADPRAARVVELRFFGGLEEEEVAEVLGVSAITVKRDWKAARAWLVGRLQTGKAAT
ncbi:MAG: ECF-type sigma factor [Candidatus Solibacter sp.]